MMSFMKTIREEFLGINQRNLDFIYPNNPRRHFPLADNKVLTKQKLENAGIKTPVTYGVVQSIGDIEPVWNQVKEYQKLVIKPASGRGGSGILLLEKKEGKWFSSGKPIALDAIFSHMANTVFGLYSIADSDQVIIERCIVPHPFFAKLYPKGIPDIRIITLNEQAVISMLRLPTHKSKGKANLHQGGLGIGIDLPTGRLKQAYDGKRYHDLHPDTDQLIKGRQLPQWEQVVELAIRVSKVFPLNYLGIDLVIDRQEGPQILEINVRPGLGIQMANKQGLKKIIHQLNKDT